jgi:hypothetical protein
MAYYSYNAMFRLLKGGYEMPDGFDEWGLTNRLGRILAHEAGAMAVCLKNLDNGGC